MLRNRLRKPAIAAAVVAALGIGVSTPAHSLLLLSATLGGVNVCAADNNLGCTFGATLVDTNPTIGILALAPVTIGGLSILGSAQTSIKGSLNTLNTSSLEILNTTGAPVAGSLAISDTSYISPVVQAYFSGSGTWQTAQGSTINLGWFDDPTNAQGAESPFDRPGDLIGSFFDSASLVVDAFSVSGGPITVNDPDPFSMTLTTDFNLVAGGSLVSRGQTEVKPVAVPEPMPLALVGAGLLGLVAMRRKK